jgi:hypothetical protein
MTQAIKGELAVIGVGLSIRAMRRLVSSNKTMRNRTALTGWADLSQLVIWLLWSWPKALLSSLYAVILKQRVIKPKKIS